MFAGRTTAQLAMVLALSLGSVSARAQAPDFEAEYADEATVADPLQWMNRGVYHVNDRLYFWIMKPVATSYAKVLPESTRQGIRNMFANVAMPCRFVGCVLQGRLRDGGAELGRFGINTTVGFLGWRDAALDKWDIAARKEDSGQVLGAWGLGPGISLTLPVFGPSNLRDTVGLVGDMFLDPTYYIGNVWVRGGLNAGRSVNNLSLMPGEYEKTKADALDHYVSLRDMYEQYRNRQIAE